MLETSDVGRDEDAEMADVRVGQVDDPLAAAFRASVLCRRPGSSRAPGAAA